MVALSTLKGRTPMRNADQGSGSGSCQQRILSINISWTNITREKLDHGVAFVLSCRLKLPYRTPVHDVDLGSGSGWDRPDPVPVNRVAVDAESFVVVFYHVFTSEFFFG